MGWQEDQVRATPTRTGPELAVGLLCPWMSAPTPLLCSTGLQAPPLSGQRSQDPHGLCQATPGLDQSKAALGPRRGARPQREGLPDSLLGLNKCTTSRWGSADSTFCGRCRANALCPLLPPNNEVKRQGTVTMVRVSGQRPRVRGGSEPRCWAGMWPALGGGERGRGEGRGLRPSTGPSPVTGTEPELSLYRAERTAPDTELPRAPDTKVHLRHKPQAATTCCPAQLGRWGPQMGTEEWGGPPRSSAPCWVSRKGGVPFPSPNKPQVPPATPGPLWSAGLFMLTLFSPQFKRSSQPQPSLRAQP